MLKSSKIAFTKNAGAYKNKMYTWSRVAENHRKEGCCLAWGCLGAPCWGMFVCLVFKKNLIMGIPQHPWAKWVTLFLSENFFYHCTSACTAPNKPWSYSSCSYLTAIRSFSSCWHPAYSYVSCACFKDVGRLNSYSPPHTSVPSSEPWTSLLVLLNTPVCA